MSAGRGRASPGGPRADGWWARLRRPGLWAALALCVVSAAPAPAQDSLAARRTAASAPAASSAWDGSPRELQVNEHATLGQTPAGSVVFWYLNTATQNNLGELALTWGGNAPVFLQTQAQVTQPGFVVANWRANDLRVTNVSANNATPIRIRALGPGMPGAAAPLATGPPGVQLASGLTAQGPTEPRYMQLVVQATSGMRSVVAVIGGPRDSTGNNAYVIAVNDTATTGPPGTAAPPPPGYTVTPPPPGYYATTRGNTYVFNFRWGGAAVFVANLSAGTAEPVTLVLRAL